jgi:hypothetical protein
MNFIERQLEDPVRFGRIKRGFYVGLAVVALVEIVLPRIFHGEEPHFAFESWPAFGSGYGLISCVAIIVVSKLIGKIWLMRREDYYD